MSKRRIVLPTIILLSAFGATAFAQSAATYLPMEVGNRWVLRNSSVKKPVTFEVLQRDGDGFRIRFDSPFATNDWTLVARDSVVLLTRFGQNGQMANLPSNSVFFDFGAAKGKSWKMTAGDMKVVNKSARVNAGGKTYEDGIQIQQGKDLFYTFAPGVGFVQFGEGKGAFVLDAGASKLPSPPAPVENSRNRGSSNNQDNSRRRRAPVEEAQSGGDDSRPVQHVPGGDLSTAPPVNGSIARNFPPRPGVEGPMLMGITVNTYANEPQSTQNLLARWQQSMDTGATFVVSNGKWDELERKKGNYDLDGLKFQVSEAQKHNLQIAYTLRLIDTVERTMPSDLMGKKWTDREMESRVMGLINAMVPQFKGRVKWFMFGNEIDGYFGRHPDEIGDFAKLYDKVSKRVKELAPGVLVSSTMMYGGIETLNGQMKPLNDRWDFLAITYYPIRGDFTMKDPNVVGGDFDRMRQAAEGRGVVLQEIGYASSSTNDSSEEKQAQFVRNVFREMREHRDTFDAGSFFLLADLSDQFVKNLAGFYGMPNVKTFLAFLQTTGLYDLKGRPKKAWSVFEDEMKNLR